MIDEKKLKGRLKWLIKPFETSFNVPSDLVDKIVAAVKECEIAESEIEAPAIQEE